MTYPQPQTPTWANQPAAAGPAVAPSRDAEEATFGGDGGGGAPFLNIGPATSKRAAYSAPGQPLGGIITRIQEVHAHKRGAYDAATGKYGREPQYYKKGPKAGQPIMQFKLTLQTDLRDPSLENDTGLRAFELTGMDAFWEKNVSHVCRKRAARLAVEASGAKSLQVGGQLLITYTGTVSVPGLEQDPINWAMQYTPPGSFASFETPPAEAPQVVPAFQQPAPPVQAVPPQAPTQPVWSQPAAPAPAPAAVPSWAQ